MDPVRGARAGAGPHRRGRPRATGWRRSGWSGTRTRRRSGPELVAARIEEIRGTGARTAVRVSPQHTLVFANTALDAGVDVLVIQGTVVSAEHVAAGREPLNLKTFIAALDIPVVVGGCSDYQTALHLMRTGAAGVIVGYGAHAGSTTHEVLGIEVPMATAIADAAAARRDYLDETGGRYVHLVAYGDMMTGGDIAKAIACGADAVMLGEPLALAAEAPGARLVLGPDRLAPEAAAVLAALVPRPARRRTARATGRRRCRRCCSARPRTRPARATSSARCAGRWRSAATPA